MEGVPLLDAAVDPPMAGCILHRASGLVELLGINADVGTDLVAVPLPVEWASAKRIDCLSMPLEPQQGS